MDITGSHWVHVRTDQDKTLYKLLMWCGKHIAPNYDEWTYVESTSSGGEVVFMFADKQHACEFALMWS